MRVFKRYFFPINLSHNFGYEVPRRGPLLWPLLWPVIHSVQSSLTPLLSTSVPSQHQNILGLLLKFGVQDKKTAKTQREPQFVQVTQLCFD